MGVVVVAVGILVTGAGALLVRKIEPYAAVHHQLLAAVACLLIMLVGLFLIGQGAASTARVAP